MYVSKAGVFVYGNTQNCYDLPAGHYSVIRPTKAQNYPEEATEDYPQGVLLILGSVIGGNNEKSYRLFLFSYGDNLYYAYDWWGTVGKWLKITAVKQS